jgi:ATP synthase (E/31 kDa) subunit
VKPGHTSAASGRRTRGTAATAVTALAPVRAHLLGVARGEADRIRAAARGEAEALLRQARADAERAVGLAAAQGEADAAPAAAAARSRGRAQARAIILGVQRDACDELRRRVRATAQDLRGDPDYELFLTRLTALAARTAGPDATVTVAPGGGVLARAGQVIVDCSLPRLAAQATDALGDRVRELWEP